MRNTLLTLCVVFSIAGMVLVSQLSGQGSGRVAPQGGGLDSTAGNTAPRGAAPRADGRRGGAKATPEQAAHLPVSSALLFSSGVAYFERSGTVTGNTHLDLSFPVSDINDILKSLVLQDLGGGHIDTVAFDSKDPTEKTLRSFALDLTDNPTFASLLNQARGEKITVEWQGQSFEGSILGVESRKQRADKEVIDVDYLNIATPQGLRSLPLNEASRVQLQNEHLQAELMRALEVLASSHDTHKRTLRLHFRGEGKREVRVGYVIENPIWKTSYRLVLDKDRAPLLQGWAIVDNASDQDWEKVHVTLVSGRPISFKMDLYTPLYAERPQVTFDLMAGLQPRLYDQDLAERVIRRNVGMKEAKNPSDSNLYPNALQPAFPHLPVPSPSVPPPPAPPAKVGQIYIVGNTVTMAATTPDLGDFFQYVIKNPVNLVRRKSAMLPIVNADVEGTRFSIYNHAGHEKHPFLGLRLKNTSGAYLMQGPITVFEGNSYAGDARILDLPVGQERLISYAVDLGTEVARKIKSHPDKLLTIKIVKGVLEANYKQRRTTTYEIKNNSDLSRRLLIEHVRDPNQTLVAPEKPAETTRDQYRFEVKLKPGEAAAEEVIEEQTKLAEVALLQADNDAVLRYLSTGVVSPQVKKALQKVVEFKQQLTDTTRKIADVQKQLELITQDQQRIRQNMERLPMNSPPYQRYLKKLDTQESRIEELQAQVMSLRTEEQARRKELEAYLSNLTLE